VLSPGAGAIELPRYFAQRYAPAQKPGLAGQVRASLAALNSAGYWPAPLPQTSHAYRGPAGRGDASGDFATTHVGDEYDTSPFTDARRTPSVSTAEYLRNMNILILSIAR
jgi:hypothetical protein